MTEATTLKSPPESKNDESDGSTNVETNQDGGTSAEASNEVLIGTTNKDDTCSDSTRKDKSAQPSKERGLFFTDEEGSNDTNDLFRFSDSDFHEKDGSTSSDKNESKHEDYRDKDDVDDTKILSEKTDNRENIFKKPNKDKDKEHEKTINFDNSSSSDEEADYAIPQIASTDGGETSKTNDAFVVSEENLSSSDDETDILSQIATTIYEEDETTKAKGLCEKEENDQSSSDDDITYIPTYEQNTFNDGGECSKTKDAGPSKEKNLSFDDEVQAPTRPPRNKAERKINYTVPFKKFKKY